MFTNISGNNSGYSFNPSTPNMSVRYSQPQGGIAPSSVQQPPTYAYNTQSGGPPGHMYATPNPAYGGQGQGSIAGGGANSNAGSGYGAFPTQQHQHQHPHPHPHQQHQHQQQPQQGVNFAEMGDKTAATIPPGPHMQLPYGYGQQSYQQQQQQAQGYSIQPQGVNPANFGQSPVNVMRPYPPQQNPAQPPSFHSSANNSPMHAPNPYAGGGSSSNPRFQQQYQPYPQHLHSFGGPMTNHPMHRGGNGWQRRHGSFSGGGGPAGMRKVHNTHFYNQHHHTGNNAVPEKTPTVHMRHPTSNKVLSVKLNRIYSTMAELRDQLQHLQHCKDKERKEAAAAVAEGEPGKDQPVEEKAESTTPPPFDRNSTKLVLCLDFLSLQGCAYGSGCDKVHVAGLEYTWEPIEPATEVREVKSVKSADNGEQTAVTEKETMYRPGFVVRCYDPTLTKYYNIPSESIIQSTGSEVYIDMFNKHGDNFKTKFKLCPELINRGQCESGSECEDIHCVLSNFSALEENHSHRTHVNDPEAMAEVPRLAAEITARIYEPNSVAQFKDYAGNYVLITEGAKTYQKYFEQENHSIPLQKHMQHCAHFRLKDMCRQGESCRFLHVLPTPEEAAAKAATEARPVAETEKEGEAAEQPAGTDAEKSSA